MATQIFISYAHVDHELLEQFTTALLPVTDRLGLEVWWDRDLKAGQAWNDTIRAAIDASDVFVLFVTNAFLKPGGYIMKTEVAAIREAKRSRGALILPVIAKSSHWEDEFGDLQCVPKTKRQPRLKPIDKWSPRSEGYHEASRQLKQPVIDFVNAPPPRPDPGPGPTMVPTSAGFAIVGKHPTEAERTDPSLLGHHADILGALADIEPLLPRLDNVDKKLVEAVKRYAAEVKTDFGAVALDRLWSCGALVCDRIETVSEPDMAEVFEARQLRDLTGDLDRLHRAHSALIMSTTEGRDLVAKVSAHRSANQLVGTRERAARAVLSPMVAESGLLEPGTRAFVAGVTEPLDRGTERLDEIEAGIRLAIHALAAFYGVFDPLLRHRPDGRPDEAEIRRRFAGDAHLEAILAAFDYISRNQTPIAAFATDTPELRRYVERTSQMLKGVRPAPLRDPGEPPPEFSEDAVREMIVRGEEVPDEWVDHVTILSFFDNRELSDLAPIAKLRGLQYIDISKCVVSDLSPLVGLTALQAILCLDTSVTDLSPLAGITSLKWVDCSSTSVTDLSPLAGLTGLTILNCSSTSVTDLSPLAGLTALATLICSSTSVTDLSPLAGLTALDKLYCWSTSITDLSPLIGLTALTILNCSSTSITDLSPLARLAALEALFCSGTSITDLSPLARLTKLKSLDCSETAVSDLSVLAHLTSLNILDASGLRLAVAWPEVWPAPLEQLNLRGSSWPKRRPLPDVPWRIAPDGSVRRGDGEAPFPFEDWSPAEPDPPPPPPPEG